MAYKHTVPAEIREDAGKGASRRLRRAGKLPAILYGGDRDPVSLSLDHDFMVHASAEESFYSSVLEIKVGDGRTQKVVLRDLQRHPFKARLVHADFQRIDEKEQLRLSVPLHFLNEEESPAGKEGGVVVSHLFTELEISALPSDLPEYIEVDLARLEPGDSIMMSDLKLPEGVTIPALEVSEDADTAVVSAIYVRAGQGTGELAAEADAALAEGEEPEVSAEEETDAEAEEGEGGDEEASDEDKDA